MEVAHDNAVVVLTDFKLTAAGELVQVLEEAARLGRPVLVVADDIEGEALAIMVVNRLRGTVASVGVRCPDTGDRRRALLEDLALLTGARTYTAELGRSLEQFSAADFGRAKRVVVDRDTTTLIEGAGRPAAIREQIAQLEHEIETSDTDYDRDWLRERIARLGGGIAVIRVGAPTETEMAERSRASPATRGARTGRWRARASTHRRASRWSNAPWWRAASTARCAPSRSRGTRAWAATSCSPRSRSRRARSPRTPGWKAPWRWRASGPGRGRSDSTP